MLLAVRHGLLTSELRQQFATVQRALQGMAEAVLVLIGVHESAPDPLEVTA